MGRAGLCASRAVRLADAWQSVSWFLCGFEFGFFGMLYVGLPYLIGSGEL